jgi:hypothetical protein
MLIITNIDDCNFSLHGDAIGIAGLKVLSKVNVVAKASEPVYNELQGRITIYDIKRKTRVVMRKPVSLIKLDGTVYASSQDFVVAFNAIMAQCCCAEIPIEPTTTQGEGIGYMTIGSTFIIG